MKRKIAAGLAIFLCIGAAGVYAANPNGFFKGFQKVNIKVNGESVNFSDVPAFMISEKTVMPIKEASEALQGMVEWNADTFSANIVNPNVHILLSQTSEFKEDDDRYVLRPFSLVQSGSSYSFVIYTEIDNLPKEKYLVKIAINNPNGERIYISEEQSNDINGENLSSFIFKKPVKSLSFKEKGMYKINILMKKAGTGSEFVTVGQKTITAK